MISFELSEEQEMARVAGRRLATDTLRPKTRGLSAQRESLKCQSFDAALLDEISSLGIVQGVALAAIEGDPNSRLISALMIEELAWGDANAALAISTVLGFVRAIAEYGTEAQRREILPVFAEYRYVGAAIVAAPLGLSAHGTIDPVTTVTAGGQGWILNGGKALVPFAGRCEYLLVLATEGEGMGAFIVHRNTPGVKIGEMRITLGCCASECSDVTFHDVEIPQSARLGDRSWRPSLLSNGSRIAKSAILTGLAKGAVEDSMAYAKERRIGGQIQATKQSIAMMLVDMFASTDSMRWMYWRAAGQMDRGDDATRYSSLAHGRAVDCAGWITDEALQIMSGHGFMSDGPIESKYRNAITVSSLDLCLGL